VTETWFTFFALLTVAANVVTLLLWGFALASNFSDGARERWHTARDVLGDIGLPVAALVATAATTGSLYLSEGAHLLPCKLCWYQRSTMYPLAAILVVGAARRDWGVRPYALTLALLGPLISIYHYVIERFPSLEVGTNCDPTNPCTITLIWKFHYISIPFMALSAFALVATVLLVAAPPDPWDEGPARDDGSDGDEVSPLPEAELRETEPGPGGPARPAAPLSRTADRHRGSRVHRDRRDHRGRALGWRRQG
jgi:disulfide bond formation protein DsbB